MVKELHPNTRTTAEIRREIRQSPESQRALAKRLGINPKTVAKWKVRERPDDLPSGPRPATHRRLSADEEAIIIGFREHTLLPLDDCLYSLQARIPHLTRSTLHRCLKQHGISRLPPLDSAHSKAREANTEPIGSFHIDVAGVQTGDGPIYLFVAIDQASKYVFVELAKRSGNAEAAAFLSSLTAAMPFPIHTVLTLDASPFITRGRLTRFARMCRDRGIEHRLTTIRHPWTSGRVERMDRMIRRAGDDHIGYVSHADLAEDLRNFVWAYNHRRRLKTLHGLTPHDFICRKWQANPLAFLREPSHEFHHEIMGRETTPT